MKRVRSERQGSHFADNKISFILILYSKPSKNTKHLHTTEATWKSIVDIWGLFRKPVLSFTFTATAVQGIICVLQSLLQLGLRSPQRKRSSWKKIDR
jgi:hypothetical protein